MVEISAFGASTDGKSEAGLIKRVKKSVVSSGERHSFEEMNGSGCVVSVSALRDFDVELSGGMLVPRDDS